VTRLACCLALVLLLANAVAASAPEPAAISSVGAEAYALAVGTPPEPLLGSPRLVLPPEGGALVETSAGLDVMTGGGLTTADQLAATLEGTVRTDGGAVTSTATVGFVELFDGVVRATNILVVATSTREGGRASSVGSTSFGSLLVAGLSYPNPRPNERVELPNLGYVVLNEQLVGGDGIETSSTVVRALRLRVTEPNVQDVPPGTEFVVASAASGIPEVTAVTAVVPAPLASESSLPSVAISTRAPIDTTIDQSGGVEPLDFDNVDDDGGDNDNDASDADNGGTTTTAGGSSGGSQRVVVTVVVVVATPTTPTPTATPSRGATATRTATPTPRR